MKIVSMTKENNQCDGCIRGLPLNDYGNHIDVAPGGIFGCTKDRYNENNLSDTVEVCGVEIRGRYDGVSHRQDKEGNNYSRIAKLPINENELCKHGKIYTVELISDYKYKILSEREDKSEK